MEFMKSFNMVTHMRVLLTHIMHGIFPPDQIDTLADTMTLEKLTKLLRPRKVAELSNSLALFDFNEKTIRLLIHSIKYRKKHRVAALFGTLLAEYMESDLDPEKKYLIVPIPLYRKKLLSRGYNQSMWIAEHMIKSLLHSSIQMENELVVRIRDTESQTKMPSKAARKENMRHAFGVAHPERVTGQHFILIDDVATTGATAADARRALQEAGAKSVFVLVVASGN